MGDNTAIEWAEATWNPIAGCTVVSPGCTNCYAMKTAAGLERRFGSVKYAGLTRVVNGNVVWTGELRLVEAALGQPLRWRRPRRIFVNSMSDLFHENLPDAAIDRVVGVMARAPQHRFMALTKRADRMRRYFDAAATREPLANLWLGVSVEDQARAEERIPQLLATPAALRFLSCEPLLGPLDLRAGLGAPIAGGAAGVDWVIAGGESGPGARPMHADWARALRDQCRDAGVPFFFKQWGAWAPEPDAAGGFAAGRTVRAERPVGKKRAGRLLDGRSWDELPG